MNVVITEPPSAPSRSSKSKIRQGHIGEEEIDKEEVTLFAFFCKMMLKEGDYVALLAKFYIVDKWFAIFAECGLFVTLYLYALMCAPGTVLKRFVLGIQRNLAQSAVFEKASGEHPNRIVPQFHSGYSDVISVSNVCWTGVKQMNPIFENR